MSITDMEFRQRGTRVLTIVLLIWALAVAVAAQIGLYHSLPPMVLAPLIALGIIVPVIAYALSKNFQAYIRLVGIRPLAVFHIWRIGAALLFFWYGAHNLLPPPFVLIAGGGDLIAGLLAVGVALLPETRNRYLVFEIFGFADFVAAVGTGLTMFLMGDPRMAGIQALPMALIPFYGVGISGASHIMAFDLLRRHDEAGAGPSEPGSTPRPVAS